jgi:hypothetical protein
MKMIFSILILIFSFTNVQATETKDWTLLVFMNGHDSLLGPYTTKNIDWMQSVGSNDKLNIVVEKGDYTGPTAQRLYVGKNNTQVIQQLDTTDMGDYKALQDFMKWTVDNYPAKHYFVVVWDHGSGWTIQNPSVFNTNDISFDSYSNNHITTEELGQTMKYFSALIGHKVDVYGSDACMMAMAEVAGEMSDYVGNFVGSQESEPLDGWPYHYWLQKWTSFENPSVNDITAALTDSYVQYYSEVSNRLGSTFSAWDLNYFDQFAKSVAALSLSLKNLKADQMQTVYNTTQNVDSYEDSSFKDFKDFTSKLGSVGLTLDKDTMKNIDDSFAKLVTANKADGAHSSAKGLSVWMPTYNYTYETSSSRYKALKFDQKAHWSDFLEILSQNN